MTMSWADDVADGTSRSSRPTRANYVPPHLRNNPMASPDSSSFPFPDESSYPGYHLKHSGGREFGRSSRGRWGDRRRVPRQPNPFDVADKFAGLGITEEESNGDGEGINFEAYEDIPVETSGLDVPLPVSTFAEIDLGKALTENIMRCRYVKPTPVQRHAIPISIAGRDLMACAQTGSGKTAAFCFPIISGIMKNQLHQQHRLPSRGSRTAYPNALILSPTRELSCQQQLLEENYASFYT
ncbi:DEAD-box ATP-dependent RNA helicase 52C-like [Macadamia integrifolia]|uniref:DEAD-box ATP-dependent RNA helicase 52C-like n=1 Tax=Macadamia integrifolia TaxID=60698 RepID=UPI001C4EFAC2|nr:DEAD-box ATP-dependent RNA helicase 52C-like [Macadamia integrifolia]